MASRLYLFNHHGHDHLDYGFLQNQRNFALEKRVKIDSQVFQRYWQILKNPTFIAYALCATTGLMMFFVFFSSSPYIVINLLHTPVKDFGYYFFIVGLNVFCRQPDLWQIRRSNRRILLRSNRHLHIIRQDSLC